MKKMLIVDGNSILNRAFYGIRLLTNKDGLYTNAVYGMITMLSHYISEIAPDYCAVAFDLKAPTFRHKMFDGYKATRKGMPEELAVQMPYAKECMSAMGLNVVSCSGYEADDILGTLARSISSNEIKVYILTGDRDSLQLINKNVSVMLVRTKETVEYDEQRFEQEYGTSPKALIEIKALMGDSSDNIPGVAGVGEKTALKLIGEYSTIDTLYNSLETADISPSLKNKLKVGKEMAYMSKALATICCDAPINADKESYIYNGADNTMLKKLFIKLDFNGLIKKFGLDKLDVEFDEKQDSMEEDKEGLSAKNVYKYETVSNISLLDGDILSLDTSDESIAIFDGKNYCRSEYSVEVAELLKNKKVVSYSSKAMYKDLIAHGINIDHCLFDCMLAAYILDPSKNSYSLDELSVRYMNKTLSDDTPRVIIVYELFDILKIAIEKIDATELLRNIEIPMAYTLAEMENVGFKIDTKGIEEYGKELEHMADILQSRIYCYAMEEFNISSTKQLSEILFDKLQLPKSKKTKTGYSTDADTLKKLIPYHPIIEDILEYRQVTKLKSTYADGLLNAVSEDGRVHSVFNQTGTATGRLSSSEPNLQNIPVRTELGRKFRKFFIPADDDHVLIDADYSQIELRLLAHIAQDKAMIDAFNSGSDIHAATASKVFDVPIDQVTVDLRKRAKAVNFGIMYGMGEFSLSENLGISRKDAKEYISNYLAQFPQIKNYLENIKLFAKENGYVTTLLGRRRYIPEILSSNKNLQHFGERVAMNSPIQGTAADIIKIAMIRVTYELKNRGLDAKLILQVHDELLIESHKDCADQVKNILMECMENAVEVSVSLSVEAHIGGTWFDAK